jgi:hypothetical protein
MKEEPSPSRVFQDAWTQAGSYPVDIMHQVTEEGIGIEVETRVLEEDGRSRETRRSREKEDEVASRGCDVGTNTDEGHFAIIKDADVTSAMGRYRATLTDSSAQTDMNTETTQTSSLVQDHMETTSTSNSKYSTGSLNTPAAGSTGSTLDNAVDNIRDTNGSSGGDSSAGGSSNSNDDPAMVTIDSAVNVAHIDTNGSQILNDPDAALVEENRALKGKIQSLVVHERSMISTLEARLKDLDEARAKIMKLKSSLAHGNY